MCVCVYWKSEILNVCASDVLTAQMVKWSLLRDCHRLSSKGGACACVHACAHMRIFHEWGRRKDVKKQHISGFPGFFDWLPGSNASVWPHIWNW